MSKEGFSVQLKALASRARFAALWTISLRTKSFLAEVPFVIIVERLMGTADGRRGGTWERG
jgi:hypothetical protein